MSDTSIVRVKPGNSIGTSADTFTLTKACNSVKVSNTHATQQLYVKVYTGSTPAAALAKAVAGTAPTSTGDYVWHVPPAQVRQVEVFKNKRRTFICLHALGSGAATTFDVEGSDRTL